MDHIHHLRLEMENHMKQKERCTYCREWKRKEAIATVLRKYGILYSTWLALPLPHINLQRLPSHRKLGHQGAAVHPTCQLCASLRSTLRHDIHPPNKIHLEENVDTSLQRDCSRYTTSQPLFDSVSISCRLRGHSLLVLTSLTVQPSILLFCSPSVQIGDTRSIGADQPKEVDLRFIAGR